MFSFLPLFLAVSFFCKDCTNVNAEFSGELGGGDSVELAVGEVDQQAFVLVVVPAPASKVDAADQQAAADREGAVPYSGADLIDRELLYTIEVAQHFIFRHEA